MGIDGKYQVLTSKEMIDELSEVLLRPKFKMTKEEIIRIVDALRVTGKSIIVTSDLKVVSRDPDDNIIINTAHDGKADYVVSGDPDLIDLKNFERIKIVSVDKMLKIL